WRQKNDGRGSRRDELAWPVKHVVHGGILRGVLNLLVEGPSGAREARLGRAHGGAGGLDLVLASAEPRRGQFRGRGVEGGLGGVPAGGDFIELRRGDDVVPEQLPVARELAVPELEVRGGLGDTRLVRGDL